MQLLAGFALAVWILVLIQTVLNLRVVPRLNADSTPGDQPFVSIIIPARNEARVIERTVRAFLAQDYLNFEVIVVNDRSTDATGEIVRSISDRRLTVVDSDEPPVGWLGKPWALEQGWRHARGTLVLVVDADLIYSPPALRAAVADLESSGAAMSALLPHFEMRTFAEHVAMPMLPFFVFSGMPLWYSNRSRSPRLALGGGAGNLVRREALESAGGFVSLKQAVVDDIALAELLRHRSFVTRAVRADDLISVRMYHSAREIIDGFTKNVFSTFRRSYIFALVMMLLLVVLHLLPFVFALLGNALAMVTVVLITLDRIILFRSFRYRLDNAIVLHPLMVSFWAYIFLRSTWFTGVRNELRWRGRSYDAAQTRFGAQR